MTRWEVLDEQDALVGSYPDAGEAVAALNGLRRADPSIDGRARAIAFDDNHVRIPGVIFRHVVRQEPQ